MKTASFLVMAVSIVTLAIADEPKVPQSGPVEKEPAKPQLFENWGTAYDPAGDCGFKLDDGKFTVTVPGSATPHDLSAELTSATAPRVLQPLKGDFVIEVKIDGEFEPSGESTQFGRTGYTGAGLVVFADARNYVRLERATLHTGQEPQPYTNFEVRVDGELEQAGTTADLPTVTGKPTWLRLERKGNVLHGSMSQDGITWTSGKPRELTAKAWQNEKILGGIAAISTSTKQFAPIYSGLSVQQGAVTK
jgi:regulation of enolase protein 1 (concanavalin A-like superfamily)